MTCSNAKAPVAHNDNQTANVNETAIVDVQRNDVSQMPFDIESVRLIDASGDEVTILDVDGKGTWDVNTDTGSISFIPVDDFAGSVNATYQIKDSCGKASNVARVTVAYNATCTSITDSGSTLGTLSMIILMILTGLIGLYYMRREELRNK
ncbi:MAG: hypothetical protein DSZ08_02515 [Sulfurovum sp.]|nr:MAG: hypothetical protein DSZ08_02515 [Sulfurovum sp.]